MHENTQRTDRNHHNFDLCVQVFRKSIKVKKPHTFSVELDTQNARRSLPR